MESKAKIDSPNVKKLLDERRASPNLKERRRTIMLQQVALNQISEFECGDSPFNCLKVTKIPCSMEPEATFTSMVEGVSPLKNLESNLAGQKCSPLKLNSPMRKLSMNSNNESNNRMKMLEQRFLQSKSPNKENKDQDMHSNLDNKSELSLNLLPSSPQKEQR